MNTGPEKENALLPSNRVSEHIKGTAHVQIEGHERPSIGGLEKASQHEAVSTARPPVRRCYAPPSERFGTT